MTMSLNLWAQAKDPAFRWAAGLAGGLGDNWDLELAASYRPVLMLALGPALP